MRLDSEVVFAFVSEQRTTSSFVGLVFVFASRLVSCVMFRCVSYFLVCVVVLFPFGDLTGGNVVPPITVCAVCLFTERLSSEFLRCHVSSVVRSPQTIA